MSYKRKFAKANTYSFQGAAGDSGYAGKSLPGVHPVQLTYAKPDQKTIQRYSEKEGFKISESKKFAVKNDGKKESQMFVQEDYPPQPLKENIVKFELKDATDEIPGQMGMKEVVPNIKLPEDDIRDIHCGAFSRRATGRQERVENETAPPGKSLHVDKLVWGEKEGKQPKKPRGSWDNHFAPVIVADQEDRGTFETAVHVDHTWFGIYGQKKREQGFRLKTVIAEINLSVKRGVLDQQDADKLLIIIQQYIDDGTISEEDTDLQKELEKIKGLIGQNPDIDEPFRKEEEEEKLRAIEREQQKKIQAQKLWELINNTSLPPLDSILAEMKKIDKGITKWDLNRLLPTLQIRAEGEKNETVLANIEECRKQITAVVVF